MTQLFLRCGALPSHAPCGLCGQPATTPAGIQLVLSPGSAPVCQACARKHDPSLAALVDLADAAQRISRIGRHSVFPPLTALLELSSAAERLCSGQPLPPQGQPPTAATG